MKFEKSADYRKHIFEKSGGKTLLAFSAGKDALSAWLALCDDGFEVIPYFLYLIPGNLSFIEESLCRYERFFGCKIIRAPHDSLFRWLRNFTFQAPENLTSIEAGNPPNVKREDVEDYVRAKAGMPDSWIATGVRAVDSPARILMLKKHGPVSEKHKRWMPVFDWRIADVENAIKKAGCGLSVEYEMFGRTFDGLDYRFLKPIKDRYPDDYRKILEWFPLADLELFRRGEKC